MKILIKQGCSIDNKSGFGDYVINGTKPKPRDKSKIEVMSGDMKLGDTISNSGKWKENEYQIILAFRGKPFKQVIKRALEEFETNFMMGFSQEEYHLDAVAHYDTDDYHIHIRIPKCNLLTGTALRLYFDAQDRKRVNLIRDTINLKYNLDTTINKKPLIEKESIRTNILNRYRLEENRIAINLNTKKDRAKTIDTINNAVVEYHQLGLIDSFKELKEVISNEFGLKIVKQGYDKPKGFHYLTIESEDKKIRIRGDIYSYKFWNNNRKNRIQQITDNRRDRKESSSNKEELEELEQRLRDGNRKRKEEVTRAYQTARVRARRAKLQREEEYKNIFGSIDLYPTDNTNTTDISINMESTYTTKSHSKLGKSRDKRGRELLSSPQRPNSNSKKHSLYKNRGVDNDSNRREVQEIKKRDEDSRKIVIKRAKESLEATEEATRNILKKIREYREGINKNIQNITLRYREYGEKINQTSRGVHHITNRENTQRDYAEHTIRDRESFRELFREVKSRRDTTKVINKAIANSKNPKSKKSKRGYKV